MKNIAGIYYETTCLPIGTKIKFKSEKQRYTVMASNVAFAICTKPMNALKSKLYTIIDWSAERRGPENLIFEFGAATPEQCFEMLARLTIGETLVSIKKGKKLDIEKVYLYKAKGIKWSKKMIWPKTPPTLAIKWLGVTHHFPQFLLPLWRFLICPTGWHLLDEVDSIEFGHYLSCDACNLTVKIKDEPKEE